MVPPKFIAPCRSARKTQSATKFTEQYVAEVEKSIKLEGIINVDVIPSPIEERVIPTLVEEQEPVTEQMDVDPREEVKNPTKEKNPTQ